VSRHSARNSHCLSRKIHKRWACKFVTREEFNEHEVNLTLAVLLVQFSSEHLRNDILALHVKTSLFTEGKRISSRTLPESCMISLVKGMAQKHFQMSHIIVLSQQSTLRSTTANLGNNKITQTDPTRVTNRALCINTHTVLDIRVQAKELSNKIKI
jgi:hypothetical protein